MLSTTTNNTIKKQQESLNSTLTLVNRENLSLSGITEILSSSETEIIAKLNQERINILGNNLKITKLDVTTGIIETTGTINTIKYNSNKNIFKKVFKW